MEKKVSLKSRIKKPEKEFPIHTKEFMNKVNERAHATDPKYVGNIDDLFRDYYFTSLERKTNLSPENWEIFHKKTMLKSTYKGKKILKKKLKTMKLAISKITNRMIETWYDFFLYQQTYYGKYQEFLIIEYFKELGKKVQFDRKEISSNKIDFVVDEIACQVKPIDSRNPNSNRAIDNKVNYIYYEKVKNGVNFYWESKVLDNLIQLKKGV
jgi:hypothetical protein